MEPEYHEPSLSVALLGGQIRRETGGYLKLSRGVWVPEYHMEGEGSENGYVNLLIFTFCHRQSSSCKQFFRPRQGFAGTETMSVTRPESSIGSVGSGQAVEPLADAKADCGAPVKTSAKVPAVVPA